MTGESGYNERRSALKWPVAEHPPQVKKQCSERNPNRSWRRSCGVLYPLTCQVVSHANRNASRHPHLTAQPFELCFQAHRRRLEGLPPLKIPSYPRLSSQKRPGLVRDPDQRPRIFRRLEEMRGPFTPPKPGPSLSLRPWDSTSRHLPRDKKARAEKLRASTNKKREGLPSIRLRPEYRTS